MSGLCTDLYEIRMAVSYLRRGMTGPATFSLFVRDLPPCRGFLVAAGLSDGLDLLARWRFTDEELCYLRDEVGLSRSDVASLAGLRFTGDVWSVPEGRVVFANEPLLEVTAPLPLAQLVETMLLNQITYQTAIASKAARCRIAAGGTELVDFAARRTHGLEAALAVARLTALVGFAGTSYVEGARRFGLRPVGTMAHSYVEAFPDELAAFRAFATDFPDATVFLVDTYGTETGVAHAIAVATELGLPDRCVGIRLDSGDLDALARSARQKLDDAGLLGARVMASGGLDEYAVARLVATGAPIGAFGVGTKVGVSADAPSLDSAYKLVDYSGRPVMKLSTGKVTAPAAKQVYRGVSGEPDILALRDEPAPADREPMLVPVMRAGCRLAEAEPLTATRRRFEQDLAWLPERTRALTEPVPVPVHPTVALSALRDRLGRALQAL